MSANTSRQGFCRLNEDVLRHVARFLHPDDLKRISRVHRVFFDEHLKSVYTSVAFCKRDKQTKEFLLHLAYVFSFRRLTFYF